LAKIIGVFTIQTKSMAKVKILLMENTLQLKSKGKLMHIFDLKGSTVNREVKGPTKASSTLKDINFLKLKRDSTSPLIDLSFNQKKAIRKMIRQDAQFLAE
jgi:hypothetical protein